MEIVINIDEDLYAYMQSRYKYQNKGDEGLSTAEEAGVAIKNGTPLPKGHGRIVDIKQVENVLKKAQVDMPVSHFEGIRTAKNYIKYVPTIIPADTESEEE